MALTPFTLPTYTGQVLPGQPATTSLKPPAIVQGGASNPHAYAQADAMQALKQAFAPKNYMPWFAQQAPAADWSKTYNTAGWMPPWVMNPGNVSTKGTNLGLGGMFGYTGNYGPSPGPGTGTWGGVPQNPLSVSAPPATFPGTKPTQPVIQQPNGTYQPGPDPFANTPAAGVPKPVITGGVKPPINPNNDIPLTWGGLPSTPQSPVNPIAMGGSTMGGDRPTSPVIQQPDGSYQSGPDPWTGVNVQPVPKLDPFAYKGMTGSAPVALKSSEASPYSSSAGPGAPPTYPMSPSPMLPPVPQAPMSPTTTATGATDHMANFMKLYAMSPQLANEYRTRSGDTIGWWQSEGQNQALQSLFGGDQNAMNQWVNSTSPQSSNVGPVSDEWTKQLNNIAAVQPPAWALDAYRQARAAGQPINPMYEPFL